MKNAIIYGVFVLVFFFIGYFLSPNNSGEIKSIKRSQIILGTVVEIQVIAEDNQKAEDVITQAFSEIKRIDNMFTTYNSESPVGNINYSPDAILTLDSEIYNLITICDSITKISNESFDISLENLTKVWGFYTNSPRLPQKEIIDSALQKSGWKNIKLLSNNKIFKKENVGLNFSAIAKGYAVDKAIDVLKKLGIKEAIVNAGGEISAIGRDWVVGIQHPRETNTIIKKLKLKNITVATSGDYEQYFEKDGFRYHHILDPKTGYPSKGLQSVTIINKSNLLADALATAVFVMGKENGMKQVESLDNTEAMIIDRDGKIFFSSGFEKFLIN